MPRIGVEAVADQWDTHDIQVNIATARRAGLQRVRPGQGPRPARCRRQAARPGRGPVVVRAGRAVPALADAARRRWPSRARSRSRSPAMRGTVPERAGRDRDRHRLGRSAVGERRAAARGEARARRAGRGRADGRPALRAVVTRDRNRADRRRRAPDRRRRAARAAPGRAPARHVPRSRVAVGGVPERTWLRLHRLSRPRRRPAHLQRGLPLRRRRRSHPGVGRRRAVAAPAAAPGRGRLGRARDGERHHPHPGRVGGVELSR